jgi:hypothetical protein
MMERELLAELEQNGIVRLPDLLTTERLRAMQAAFETRLRRMRWNTSDGYEKTEPYRHMVEDVLTLEQGFVDVGLHPVVKSVLRWYLGERFQLVEAKGWKSLATRKDFHGWHGDAWYDQSTVRDIPREVKLAMYLTDVKTGAFQYVMASHRQRHPRPLRNSEVAEVPRALIAEMTGAAGSAFLFDTSGIHRQGVPILEARRAMFYNYHDPAVPLQADDRDSYRYHPLLLNAAFLGNLSVEDRRILGFGDQRRYVPAFERRSGQDALERALLIPFEVKLRADRLWGRVAARLRSVSLRATRTAR